MTPNPKIRELIMNMGIIPEDEHYEVAELIVKECAELMENQHTWITSVAASTLIRNHFKNEKF